VLTQCGVKVTGVYLVQLNSDYIRGKELDIQELFIKTNMSKLVDTEYPDVPANIEKAKNCFKMLRNRTKSFQWRVKNRMFVLLGSIAHEIFLNHQCSIYIGFVLMKR
jgi:hypothetical protein